ncbi:hypothetical protein G210_5123, partial [Candida maltosa Xu316]
TSVLSQASASSSGELSEYTTTFTTTNSDGSVETDTGVVVVTTDSNGSLTTSTSVLPTGPIFCKRDDPNCISSEYTSTWTTTNSNGEVVTESGIFEVTTNSEGSLYTITISTFPQESAASTPTEYTTTWTTTNSNGEVETESGVVSQSGSYLTTLATFPQLITPTTTLYTTEYVTTCPN